MIRKKHKICHECDEPFSTFRASDIYCSGVCEDNKNDPHILKTFRTARFIQSLRCDDAEKIARAWKRLDGWQKRYIIIGIRDGFGCGRCGTFDSPALDHIVPRSLGGPDVLENIQILCRPCNTFKRDTVIDYRKKPFLHFEQWKKSQKRKKKCKA